MSIGETITTESSRDLFKGLRPLGGRIGRLLSRCGLAGSRARGFQGIEALENRVLLADDHPNFGAVFNTPTPAPVLNIVLNAQGQGNANGNIEYLHDNDMFRFTAPTTDFVTLWADTINEPTGVSVLNSMIQVYRRNPNNTAVLITSGRDNDQLTSGFNSEGWVGFIAQAGVEYFIRVLAQAPTLPTGMGAYVLRVDARTDAITVNPITGEPAAPIGGTLTLTGGDVVYKFTAGTGSLFNSLFTFGDQSDPAQLDGRLDIYDASGKRIAFDSEAGRLNNAYAVTRGAPGAVYYIRFRSDSFSPTDPTSTGDFLFTIDTIPSTIVIDPVTRRGSWFDFAGGNAHKLMDFISQGTGRTIITVYGAGLIPLTDPAVHVYNDAGVQIAFNDDFVGLNAQLELELTGGQRYYIVVEGFDIPNGGTFIAAIEANHTFNNQPTNPLPWDDHENLPGNFDPQNPPAFLTPDYDRVRRQFERATPLVWSDPRLHLDPAGQPYPDRSFMTDARGWGRIYPNGDSDLFQFTPQVDMLGTYTGSNDDNGTSLYAGGAFLTAGNITTTLRGPANHVVAWDAHDYFPPLRGVNGTVYAMASFDFDGDGLRELYVTGDFTTAGNTADPSEDIIVNNLAVYAWNPLAGQFEWGAVGNGLGGIGRAMVIYDEAAPTGGGPDPDPILVIGGETFQNVGSRIAIFNGAALTAGPNPNATVFALATIDLPDADTKTNPPDDPPIKLAIGGAFTAIGATTAVNRVALWSSAGGVERLGIQAQNGVNGIVRALIEYDPEDPDGSGPIEDPAPYLVLGGEFTVADDARAGTVNTSRIAGFGDFTAIGNDYVFKALGAGMTGTNAVVNALTIWNPTDPDGGGPYEDLPAMLVAGGSFTGPANNIATWDDAGWGTTLALEDGLNGTVRALAAFADEDPASVNYGGPVLYAGGDFLTFNVPGAPPGPATRMARFDWNPSPLVQDFQWGGGETDLATGSRTGGMETGPDATVYALAEFDDGNPNQWDRHDRPGTRVQVVLGPSGPFLNTFIRVYDSNFNLLYTNETIAPPFPDPSGMLDPSIADPNAQLAELTGITVWAGETYYVEVVSSGGGSGGRYEFVLTADALVEDDANSGIHEETDAGDWVNAREFTLNNASGDVRNNTATATPMPGQPGLPPTPSPNYRNYRYYQESGSGVTVTSLSEAGNLHDIDDTDLFFFRAPSNGTAEVRLTTTFIADLFREFFNGTGQATLTRPANGTGTSTAPNSHLDAVIRIFNNDFEEIASSDNNAAVGGEYELETVGTFGTAGATDPQRVFYRRDPMVAFNVIEGERYFVQIESAALADYLAFNLAEIDWRSVSGSYELMINTMPNLNFVDDHPNATNPNIPLATVIGIDQEQTSQTNGVGEIVGEIDDNLVNTLDTDLFTFLATDNGIATIRIQPTISTLRPYLDVFDQFLFPIGSAVAPAAGEEVSLQINVQQGQRFLIRVAGTDLQNPTVRTEGTYIVQVSGLGYEDDHASPHLWSAATEIAQPLYDFDGFETLAGSIEYAGDVDIFKFTTLATDLVTITIDGLGQFDPFVRVYEVTDDPAGNAVFLRLAENDDIVPGSNRDARVTFSTTAPDRVSSLSGLTLNLYYVVVSGFDPEVTRGDYTLTLQTDPSDDHPDASQFQFATDLPINGPTGQGSGQGEIERVGDTDLLSFVAAASGTGIVTINSPITSHLRHGVRMFDQDFNPIVDQLTGQTLLLGADTPNSTVTFKIDVVRDQVYYILVQGGPVPPLFVNKNSPIGKYTIGITTPTADDHANENEWELATNVPLSIVTGDGSATGVIGVPTDTDLFQVISIADSDLRISIDTPGSEIRPVLRLFRADFSEIGDPVVDGGEGDEDGLLNGSVVRTISAAIIDDVHYFLVSSSPEALITTGSYAVTIRGDDPPHFPPDDHADEGEWEDASVVSLEPLNGDAQMEGGLQFDGDTDLFTFLTQGKGRAYVQVVTPAGQSLDFAVRVFNENFEEIAFDLNGIPGANANVSFDTGGANERYFVLVTTNGEPGTGTYTVRLDTAPEKYFLFYPEGFASPRIREFIALVNPNDEAVTYTIRLKYENPALSEIIVEQNAVLGAGQRGGVTISNGTSTPLHGLVFNQPYAIVIESNAPMGASLSHYDFDTTVGENFTERTSTFWTFSRGERFPGAVADFLVFYNPNPTRAVVVLTAYRPDGSSITFTQTVDPNRRGGWSFNQLTSLPPGAFPFTITSAPETPGQAHLGIVAALSHYDVTNGAGDAYLGDPDGGATESVITGITSGPSHFAQVSIFNPGDTAAQVIMTTSYIGSTLPGSVRSINIAPRTAATIEGAALGLAANQAAGLTFTSDVKVSVLSRERQFGDGGATMAYSEAGTRWFFGDAFINVSRAGIDYFENLYFYNPDTAGVTATVRILFVDGTVATTNVFVGAEGFSRLELHEAPEILSRGGLQFFALDISAPRPISVTMEHYDLFLRGGWATKGARVGLTIPLSTI